MMSELDDIANAWGAQTEDQKQASFEASTIRLVLAQLGHTHKEIDSLQAKEEFTIDWFNDAGFLRVPLFVRRVFEFNFEQLLVAKSTHPIVVAYKEIAAEAADGVRTDDFYWIFKVQGESRMVAAPTPPADRSYLAVRVDSLTFYVSNFSKFFTGFADD